MLRSLVPLAALLAFCCLSQGAAAQSSDLDNVVSQLRGGGYVIVLRHGSTNRDQADTDPLNLENVARQRHLSDAGREQARQLGDAFRKLGIPLGSVYTSRFQRAIDTGKLISGSEVTPTADVSEGGLVVTPIENDRRAEALRKLASTPPAAGKNTLVVTHKPNILDAFGRDWFDVREGEASIFRPDPSGKPALLARVQAADWIKAAAR
ncbi:MAG: histidine phosphatase family protein [Betaproteobacteria bacterium]|nr:histidine phosphatase family protein [Betaproteobacteria bacterium]